MADGRALIALLALAFGGVAHAAASCEESRGQTGLALTATAEGQLSVAAVDPDSAAAASGIAVGDTVVQVNASAPTSCSEYARVVRDARKAHRAVLLLVRRGSADVPLALAAATWERAVAAVAPPPVAEAPTVRKLVTAPPPPPLPAGTAVSLEEVTHRLAELDDGDKLSARVETYERDVLRVHRQVETLAARRSVPSDVIEGLRTVLRYHDAAAVAWESEEAERERERRPRRMPTGEAATASYFEDSDVAATIDEFPFLRDTVSRDPSPGLVESAGRWRPRQARLLLWEHAREELAKLTAWLAAGGPPR